MAKPAFDPSQPFDRGEDLNAKPAFDPNKPFDAPDVEQPKTLLEKGVSYIGKPAVQALGAVGQAVDPYLMAPFRAAVSKAQNAGVYEAMQEPGLVGKAKALTRGLIQDPAKAYLQQFGEQGAPTSKDIAAKAGLSTEENKPLSSALPFLYSEDPNQFQMHPTDEYNPKMSTAGIVGGATEAALPGSVTALGLLGKGVGAFGKGAKTVGAALKESGGAAEQIASPFLDTANAVKGGSQVGQGLEALGSHVPMKNMQVFKQRYPEVTALAEKYGNNGLPPTEALRSRIMQDLEGYKADANTKISQFLQGNGATDLPIIPTSGALDEISKLKNQLKERLDPAARAQLDSFAEDIKSFDKGNTGTITAEDAWPLYRKFLQRGKSAYIEQGKIYSNPASPEVSLAAKKVAGSFRDALGKVSPELDSALKAHADLHNIEETIAPSVLDPGSSPNSIYQAGTFDDAPARAALGELGNLTGKNYVRDAENIAAMRAMYDPRLTRAHGVVGSAVRALGRPVVRGYERATQPGVAPGLLGGKGYGTTVKGLLRGARISQQPESKNE